MRNFRKLDKAITNFRYEVECINLLSGTEVSYSVQNIQVHKTKLRSLENIRYEVQNDLNNWEPIMEADYFKLVNEHINPTPLEIKAKDVFLPKKHFSERFSERFNFLLNSDEFTPLDFIFQNGYIFKDHLPPDMIRHKTYYLYEPMSRFLVIAADEGEKIALITTYDPTDRNIFNWTLDETGLENAPKIKDYVNANFELIEVA